MYITLDNGALKQELLWLWAKSIKKAAAKNKRLKSAIPLYVKAFFTCDWVISQAWIKVSAKCVSRLSARQKIWIILCKICKTILCMFYRVVVSWTEKYINTIIHCSKSQIFVQKFNFDKPPTFSRVFHHKILW